MPMNVLAKPFMTLASAYFLWGALILVLMGTEAKHKEHVKFAEHWTIGMGTIGIGAALAVSEPDWPFWIRLGSVLVFGLLLGVGIIRHIILAVRSRERG